MMGAELIPLDLLTGEELALYERDAAALGEARACTEAIMGRRAALQAEAGRLQGVEAAARSRALDARVPRDPTVPGDVDTAAEAEAEGAAARAAVLDIERSLSALAAELDAAIEAEAAARSDVLRWAVLTPRRSTIAAIMAAADHLDQAAAAIEHALELDKETARVARSWGVIGGVSRGDAERWMRTPAADMRALARRMRDHAGRRATSTGLPLESERRARETARRRA